MSAFGTKRTSEADGSMSAFGVTADINSRQSMSAFDPKRTWEAEFALKGLRFVLIGKTTPSGRAPPLRCWETTPNIGAVFYEPLAEAPD
jgi:hypothetical protein